MKNYVKAKAWLNTGYKNINQEIELCPFCGQALNKSDFYQTIKMYFDNSFQDYINEIASSIRSLEIKWDCTHLTEEIQKHRLLIHEEKGIFINSLDEIYDELTKLNEKVVKYEEELDKLLTDMEYNYSNLIDQKMSAPQISIDLLNHDLFTRLDDYQKYIDLFYSILDKKRKIITSMKQTLNSGTLEREIAALKIELRELNSQLCRYNEEELCKKWLDIYIEIQSIDKQIKEYETQLEESQNNYLNSYFGKISLLFSELGSKNYTIQRKKIPQRGYKPVYGIEVLFRNKPISNKMEKVFSESDRRALALSIFLTKILMLNENEKKNAIVVLDDPATSFDENRIKIINIKIKTIAQMVNQVFILAHHSSFTRDLYLSCKDKVNCYKINEIEAYNYGLYDMEPQEDLGTEYEKALIHIMKFNDRSVSDVSCNDLRIFMETYLDMVFAKQKIELNLDKLSLCDRINKYKELNLLSETAYKELHNYRELFNQESHELLGTNIESIRSVSISLISFLFNNITLNYS